MDLLETSTSLVSDVAEFNFGMCVLWRVILTLSRTSVSLLGVSQKMFTSWFCLSLTSCVKLGEFFNISGPPFPHG